MACGKQYKKSDEYTTLMKSIWAARTPEQRAAIRKKKEDTVYKKTGKKYVFQLDEIKEKIKKTSLQRYGVPNAGGSKKAISKGKMTKLKRYGKDNYHNIEKAKETCLKRYGVDNPFKLTNKMRNRYKEKLGVDNPSQLQAVKLKKIETQKKNNTFGKSEAENIIFNLLLTKFKDVKRQYTSEKYPFACDFYIPKLDLYIEYQGTWTHGGKPYENTKEDLQRIKVWKSKNTDYYSGAIIVWKEKDPLKRKTAKENHLNWLEFFSMSQFMEWYNKL